jgi:hypothetical protein
MLTSREGVRRGLQWLKFRGLVWWLQYALLEKKAKMGSLDAARTGDRDFH